MTFCQFSENLILVIDKCIFATFLKAGLGFDYIYNNVIKTYDVIGLQHMYLALCACVAVESSNVEKER